MYNWYDEDDGQKIDLEMMEKLQFETIHKKWNESNWWKTKKPTRPDPVATNSIAVVQETQVAEKNWNEVTNDLCNSLHC